MDQIERTAWDSTFQAMIPLSMETENDYDYYRLLHQLFDRLNDGHT